jgi:capsule polysaccharide export protein KpsC/LpsZ
MAGVAVDGIVGLSFTFGLTCDRPSRQRPARKLRIHKFLSAAMDIASGLIDAMHAAMTTG